MKRKPALSALTALSLIVAGSAAGCFSYTKESQPIAAPRAPVTSSYTTSTTTPEPGGNGAVRQERSTTTVNPNP